jgi:four helix bundle protein
MADGLWPREGVMSSKYQDLRAWQQAMLLAKDIYRATERFPKHELYGLASQLRRAAVSVASNIAEGKGRRTDKEFCQFLYMARGSLFEIGTQVQLAEQLEYLSSETESGLMKGVAAVGSSLTGLINSMEKTKAAMAGN